MGRNVIRLTRRRPGPRFRLIVRTLIALVLVVAVLGLAFSPLFDVRTVRVTGGPQSMAGELGLQPGIRIWQVNVKAAAEHLLSRSPQLASAKVGRVWPNAVTVQISYRHPVAVALASDGAIFGVDQTGRVLAEMTLPGTLPVLRGVASAEVHSWAQIRAKGLLTALSLAAKLEHLQFRFAEVLPGASPTIYLDSGTQVLWPGASKAKSTLAALRTVLAALSQNGQVAATIDLRSPSRPLLVLRK